jgi:hypothetical protein
MVKPPAVSEQHPDRSLECELALEHAVDALADVAHLSGWSEKEINHAILRLALARILAAEANANTDEATRRAWLGIHGDEQAACNERL